MRCRPNCNQQSGLTGRVLAGIRWALLLSVLPGCENFGLMSPPPEPAPPPRSPAADDLLLAGTVGAATVVAGVDVQPLRGFGLVIGLNGRGGSDCPSVIREYLVELMTKDLSPQGIRGRKAQPSPGELIDSLDTAVVEVVGLVAPGARKGARFDVEVRVLPGTSTQSLEGGLLLPTPMRYFNVAASGKGLVEGSVLAEASGPVFVAPQLDVLNRTLDDESGPAMTAADSGVVPNPVARDRNDSLRQGLVLGGGRALDERPIKLMLLRPNYQLAQRIERRINESFGHRPRTAEATSAGYIELHTPPLFTRQPERFRQVVGQLYLDNRPAIVEAKLGELVRHAVAGGTDLERIAATWEGIGRSVIPSLQPFYAHPDPAPSFYAARSGLRLGDLTAVPVLGGVAAAGSRELRILAIEALGSCDSRQAALHLAPVLGDADPGVRIAAYEAILPHNHPGIRSVTFRHILDQGQINFILDVVDSGGPPLIYARRTRLPRLVVFNPQMPIAPPVFYAHPDESLTIYTVDGAEDVRVFAKQRARMSEEMVLPPRVVDLITILAELPERDDAGRLPGLGFPYSRVVEVLAALSQDQCLPAEVVLEDVGPLRPLVPELAPERPIAEPAEGGA